MPAFNFDATTVEPSTGAVSPIPAGVYLAHIVESVVAPLKSGQGQSLKLTWQVLEGPHKGRKVWQSLNVRNAGSPENERIAQSELSAICRAVGRPRITDSVDLHHVPCRIRVAIEVDKNGQYADQNRVKAVEGTTGVTPGVPSQPLPTGAFQAPAAATAPAAAPPWARRSA